MWGGFSLEIAVGPEMAWLWPMDTIKIPETNSPIYS